MHPQIEKTDECTASYTIKTKEKSFPVSDYPLLQTEFLYGSKKGMADIRINV